MEKNVKISMLNQIYGNLLTEKQKQIIDDYYNNDLSLSEIAENENITRQAVRDMIKKGEKRLFKYEEELELMKKMLKQERKIGKVLNELTKLQINSTDKQIVTTIEKLKKELSLLV